MNNRLEPAARELESSLAIVAPDPERVYRNIGRLRRIDGYELVARKEQRLTDQYFDTPEETLRSRGFALRRRSVGGATLISMKGRARADASGENRLEVEHPFSPDAVEEIRRRAHLPAPSGEPSSSDPVEVLRATLGVELIQTRHTLRLVRDVVEKEAPVAELALDRVEFDVGKTTVRHYEVEVESKRPGAGARAVRTVIEDLGARYPDALMEWPFGKLATGKAVEELARQNQLETRDGALDPSVYERIKRYLSR